jgi:hypothetical protein
VLSLQKRQPEVLLIIENDLREPTATEVHIRDLATGAGEQTSTIVMTNRFLRQEFHLRRVMKSC